MINFTNNLTNSRLIQYIVCFTPTEKKEFGLFLASPLFNRDGSLLKLYDYILRDLNSPSKKEAYKSVFGNKSFKEQRINNMMTELVHHVQDFLAHSAFNKNNQLKKELLLHALRKNKSKKNFSSVQQEIEAELATKKQGGHSAYYAQYKVAAEADAFMIEQGERKKSNDLQFASDNLDLFYLVEKLRLVCEMLNRKNIIETEYETGTADVVIKYVEGTIDKYKNHPAVLIYHCIYLTLKHDTESSYFLELKKLLKEYASCFSPAEARHMYDFAENYCIKKVNSGNVDYLQQIHSIYEQLLDSSLILNDGILSESDYKNIIAVSLRIGKHDWTYKFIETYKAYLPLSQQQNAYTYNIASYYYTIKDYKNAVRMLRDVEFTDVFYHLGSKLILLKVYYETEEVESFYSLVDTFKVYLHRNKKISVYQRENYFNLVRFSKNCFNIKVNPPASKKMLLLRADKLSKKIKENKKIVSLLWLQERVEELK